MKNKKIPPCVIDEVNFCRGCPGWNYMVRAQKNGEGLWKTLPVYCAVTGFIKYPDKYNNEK